MGLRLNFALPISCFRPDDNPIDLSLKKAEIDLLMDRLDRDKFDIARIQVI